MNYLGHDLYQDRLQISKQWYRCKKCKIRYFYGEFVSAFYSSDHAYDNLKMVLKDITCEEYIIKSIIE